MSKNIVKAEMWDKMQYLFRNYYDRMVHAVLHFDDKLDIEVLKNVIVAMVEKAPVLHCRFCENPVHPYWKKAEYTIDDILTVVDEPDDYLDVIEKHICQSIPATNNVQLKILIVNHDGKSSFAMIVNHMCFDGGDFKYFLKKLCRNYNEFLEGNKSTQLKTGSRSHEQVYTMLDEDEYKHAKGLYKNISQIKDKHTFPLTPSEPNDYTMINRRKIDRDTFITMKKIGKAMDVTVNDLMLAVYIRALYDISDMKDDESITIPCMVDLRRHIKNVEEGGLANHTGFMQCSVKNKGETINDTLIEVLRSVKISKRDKYMGLYSLPLLKLAYTILPFAISEFAIKIGYNNPLIGMSNIGLLPVNELTFGTAKPVDGFMTGAVKYKPFMQLALTTLNDEVTMSIAIRGNEKDKEIVEKFFDLIQGNIADYIALNRDKLN